MNLTALAVEKRAFTTFAAATLILGGIGSYFGLGQLEDPEFTVKTGVVSTPYAGASPLEVELEVTDRIELALQELASVKNLSSFSRAGMSSIAIDIKPQISSEQLPQVWDEIRKKIRDVTGELPPGAGKPAVSDDFGEVYGFLLAVVGDGFTQAELKDHVDAIRKELSLVEGVARADLWGDQTECIYVEVAQARLSQLGLTMADVQNTLAQQNTVVDAGSVDILGDRLRMEVTGEFTSPEDLADLVMRGGIMGPGSNELLRLRDFASVKRGYVEPTNWEMRFNGMPAIGVSMSNLSGENTVLLGARLDAAILELSAELPIGIEIQRVSWQSDLVQESIVDFMVSLLQAVGIVLIVLWIALGLRTALIVGLSGLVFTIAASLLFMNIFGVDLQRMSLGALVIAMGMMVDNAIVVADGVVVRMQRGMERVKAAVEAGSQPSIPLLGATVIAVMAFYPIMASEESAGEYCQSLFTVIAIALIISWVFAVTITPLMCIWLLPEQKATDGEQQEGRMYGAFRSVLGRGMRSRGLVMGTLLLLLAAAGFGFLKVDQLFFPDSARPQMMVDYWAPEGTRIEAVSADLRRFEQHLASDPRIDAITTFVGQGPPRFYLPVDPESPYASYGQLILNTSSYEIVQDLIGEIDEWAREHSPQAIVIPRKYGLGPFETWPVEARFSGPATADPNVLRGLADQAVDIMGASSHALAVRTNWRNRVQTLSLDYDQNNARWTAIARADIAQATLRAYDGAVVGQFREDDELLPIMLRHPRRERDEFASSIDQLQIRPPMGQASVPLAQVTRSIATEWEDPLIWRWDRRRAITVQSVPRRLASTLRAEVLQEIEAIELPVGYRLEWEGEFSSSGDAQASLIPGIIPALVIVALIVVGLFNAFRPALIIAGIIPFALIGVTLGLLATGQPFGFVALLGGMSLGGMMIKNAIVLLDEINLQLAAGKGEYQAVCDAAVSRLRPVLLAAATTVLGVIPLLGDVFWVSLAVTIMFGLTLGSALTMIVIPVLYGIFFRLPRDPAPSA
jgi:multidrug efflux pump subunit AcrB